MQNKVDKGKRKQLSMRKQLTAMTFGMKDRKPTLFCFILKQTKSRNSLETFDNQYNITLRAPYTAIILKTKLKEMEHLNQKYF